jgi:Universal stress protein family
MPNVRIDVCQCLRQGHDGEWGSPCGSDVLAVLSSRYKAHVPLKGDMSVYKCILIATDGSALAKKAEAGGLQLAKTLNAEVIAVTVTEPADALSMSALAERTMSNPTATMRTA